MVSVPPIDETIQAVPVSVGAAEPLGSGADAQAATARPRTRESAAYVARGVVIPVAPSVAEPDVSRPA